MRVPPQVSDRIKEAPAQVLRGVFAGIGQLLLITDKLRNKTSAQVPQARAPQPTRTRPEPVPLAPPGPPTPAAASAASAAAALPVPPTPPTDGVTEAGDLNKTGNVRLLTSEEAGAGSTAPALDAMTPVSQEAAVTEEAAAAPVTEEAEVTEEAAAAPVTEAEPDVPLPNYDQLPVASLRARLRNLDAAQVKQLAEYERAHAARADIIAMFERRMAKLEASN